MTKEDNQYLYHYTTLDAFINIVDKQELWASNVFYLNDSAEFHLAIALARDLLRTDISNETNVQKRQGLEIVARLVGEVTPGVTMKPSCFVCSFSEEKDDLSQWRAYCRNGGVAVGFPRNDLLSLTGNQGLGFAPVLVPCIYEEGEQREEIRLCICRAVAAMPRGTFGTSMSPQEVEQFRAGFLQHMLVEKPIKSEDFASEREWRLIARPDPGMGEDERLGFRCRDGSIIPYWIIALDPNKDGNIWRNVRVVVGPNPHPQELKASVEGLLKRYCRRPANPDLTSSQVENSKVTHRYW